MSAHSTPEPLHCHNALVQLRIADPLIGLSAIGDLGRGLEPGHAARTCFIGCRLARALDAGDDTVRAVFYTALLQHIGCIAHAHDTAALDGGRTIQVLSAADRTDFSRPADILSTFLTEVSDGGGLLTRLRLLIPAARMGKVVARTSCEVGEATARRIGLSADVQTALRHMQEWYNGKGGFLGSKGEEIPLAARIVLAAFTVSIFDLLAGPQAAVETARMRAATMLDPDVADCFVRQGEAILTELSSGDVLRSLSDEEPDPKNCVGEDGVDEIAIAVGEAVDLKTPYTHGAARRAFDIVGAAAPGVGLETAVAGQASRAAALRDIGKAALNNAVLEKPGPLTEIDREQVRLHAYHSERVLSRSPALAAEVKFAGLHHERQDGNGYHRGLNGVSIPMAGRVIAAADALVAMTQPRPQRAALSLDEACARLTGDRGLDADAVAAVVAAAQGSSRSRRRRLPAGLSERQVEVLRLVAKGLTNRQIAERLVVSPRTAEHHVQDIYLKIGVASRAAAALFASEHDLL
jgi:HD-GYP domain-containing protein (c-di-GMP phosphodiesterase class II)